MGLDDLEQVLVTSRAELRAWLEANADTSPSIWLVTYKRASGKPAPTYDDIVEEALCFGWIDSTVRGRDDETAMLLLSSRKPRSTWSAVNKARLEHLLPSGVDDRAGAARDRGGQGERIVGDPRLGRAPRGSRRPGRGTRRPVPAAREFFDGMPPGARKQNLWFVISAKRPETRAARIEKIVAASAEGRRAVG